MSWSYSTAHARSGKTSARRRRLRRRTFLAFGFFLLSLQRDVDATLDTLAGLGFDDGVRRIEMPAPGGKRVAMAVVNAPDGVRVELIGPPQ